MAVTALSRIQPTIPARRRARRGGPLTTGAIVAAARRLIEAKGMGACSMRTLVAELGVQAPAVYRRIRNKDELLALVLDHVMGDMTFPADGPWQEQLAEIMRRLRAIFARRPNLAALFAHSTPHGPNALRFIDAATAALRRAGFSDACAAFAITALTTYTIGLTFLSASRSGGGSHRQIQQTLRRERAAVDGHLAADALAAYAVLEGTQYADAEGLFEFGLRHMIAGLVADLPRLTPTRRRAAHVSNRSHTR
jgi:AcrR family transcriptional regulator